jgi:hypothetical protein
MNQDSKSIAPAAGPALALRRDSGLATRIINGIAGMTASEPG